MRRTLYWIFAAVAFVWTAITVAAVARSFPDLDAARSEWRLMGTFLGFLLMWLPVALPAALLALLVRPARSA